MTNMKKKNSHHHFVWGKRGHLSSSVGGKKGKNHARVQGKETVGTNERDKREKKEAARAQLAKEERGKDFQSTKKNRVNVRTLPLWLWEKGASTGGERKNEKKDS